MKITAFYKTFDGEEFITSSINSIYDYVDKIVMLHSNINWNGQTSINTVKPVVNKYISDGKDKDNKIVQLDFNTSDQTQQYNVGVDYINKNIECDYILFIDSDEVWDDYNFQLTVNHLKDDNGSHNALCCRMHTYIKSPIYRVDPIEPCSPIIFIKKGLVVQGVRGINIKPKVIWNDVFFHHFTLVRKDINKIREKIINSNRGDGSNPIDVNTWMKNIWDNIPDVHNLHITRNCEHFWKSIVKIDGSSLPRYVSIDNFLFMATDYYSEHQQDKWMNENIFKNKRDGVFVEIGALNGILHSNTYFYEKNLSWTGLCIEANPFIYSDLVRNRKCECENVAIANDTGVLEFESFDGGLFGWSGLSKFIEHEHHDRINKNIPLNQQHKVMVVCDTINNILHKHKLYKIDYMSIDIEGAEYDVMQTFDFEKFKVEIFDIENNFFHHPIEEYMNDHGYEKIARLGVNDIFRRKA